MGLVVGLKSSTNVELISEITRRGLGKKEGGAEYGKSQV